MRLLTILLMVLCAVLFPGSVLPSTVDDAPNRSELEAQIAEAKRPVQSRGGHIVVGRIVLDGPGDPRDVNAQMEILPGGYFAGATKDLVRPIGFRMHQYAPLDVKLEGASGELVDLGTLHMVPLAPAALVALKGQIRLADGDDPRMATAELSVRNGPVNTPGNGTSPRAHWPDPILAAVQPDGTVFAPGFSPMEYYCVIKGH